MTSQVFVYYFFFYSFVRAWLERTAVGGGKGRRRGAGGVSTRVPPLAGLSAHAKAERDKQADHGAPRSLRDDEPADGKGGGISADCLFVSFVCCFAEVSKHE